jgi:hypothetical protein
MLIRQRVLSTIGIVCYDKNGSHDRKGGPTTLSTLSDRLSDKNGSHDLRAVDYTFRFLAG